MIAGEYAVLDGAPAWMTAVNRRARVQATPDSSDVWRVMSTGGVEGVVDHSLTELCADEINSTSPAYLLSAVIRSADTEHLKRLSGATLIIDSSDFSKDRLKLGIGSSAAVTVALQAAVATLMNEPPDHDHAQKAHRLAQHGSGSGADVAAAFFGGNLWFSAGRATPFEAPAQFHPLFVWSGESASTTQLVARYRAAQTAVNQRQRDALRSASFALLESTDKPAALARFATALEQFDHAHEIGIFSPAHRRIAELANSRSIPYKPCGAGGGDLGIAWSRDRDALEVLRQALASAGYLSIDLEPTSHGIDVQL
ncbi:MAG: hypothetical protein NXH85_11600 [Pseudomonadaceae bacterium]|nr:hypothetical protein [Pseudomonadaceae bacterium]